MTASALRNRETWFPRFLCAPRLWNQALGSKSFVFNIIGGIVNQMITMQLTRYDAMCAAIEQVRAVDEVKDIRDKALAIQMYARQAKNLDAERHAAEIRVRAERKCGELLADTLKSGRPEKVSDSPTLSDMGISRDQSSQWQKLAAVPDVEFESALASDEVPSASSVLAVHFSSESEEWYTPPEVVSCVLALFGEIALDPCSNEGRSVPASMYFTKADDGLSHPWRGPLYMNPPYGRVIGDWTSKLAAECDAGNVNEAVALVPARVDTSWFQSLGERCGAVCFVDGRLKFSGHDNSAPFPSAAVYMGERVSAFLENFGTLGQVWKRVK